MVVRFPYPGDHIIAHSLFFQAMRAYAAGYCGVSDMAPSRSSASAVAVASGYWRNAKVKTAYLGGSVTGIAPAATGLQRIDLVVMEGSSGLLTHVIGIEDSPTGDGTGFLDQLKPLPPGLPTSTCYLIAAFLVDDTGVQNTAHGLGTPAYCVAGVADLRILDPAYNIIDLAGLTADALPQYMLRSILTTPGDTLYQGASVASRLAKGTSGYRFVQGDTYPEWRVSPFYCGFGFGDGSAVLATQQSDWPIPVASKIVSAVIRSTDAAGAPLAGSITVTLYKHARGAAIGTAVDSFALSSASDMTETGLSIAVAADEWLTAVISSITTCKQITFAVKLEAT